MANNKRFSFGANSIESLINSNYNITSLIYAGKCRAGFNTIFDRTTWGNGNDVDKMIDICVREILSQCNYSGGIKQPVSMVCVNIREGKVSTHTFGLMSLWKKGHLTGIPKDVAYALVEKVKGSVSLENMVRREILNWDEILHSVGMNELSLSEYLDSKR
tara:strand:- start:861 stop:1340 length:480 start_codon:yes stop_codon:yes gene_type:complete